MALFAVGLSHRNAPVALRELLAQRHRRVLVAKARREERHQAPCIPGRNSPAPSVSTSAANPTMP